MVDFFVSHLYFSTISIYPTKIVAVIIRTGKQILMRLFLTRGLSSFVHYELRDLSTQSLIQNTIWRIARGFSSHELCEKSLKRIC